MSFKTGSLIGEIGYLHAHSLFTFSLPRSPSLSLFSFLLQSADRGHHILLRTPWANHHSMSKFKTVPLSAAVSCHFSQTDANGKHSPYICQYLVVQSSPRGSWPHPVILLKTMSIASGGRCRSTCIALCVGYPSDEPDFLLSQLQDCGITPAPALTASWTGRLCFHLWSCWEFYTSWSRHICFIWSNICTRSWAKKAKEIKPSQASQLKRRKGSSLTRSPAYPVSSAAPGHSAANNTIIALQCASMHAFSPWTMFQLLLHHQQPSTSPGLQPALHIFSDANHATFSGLSHPSPSTRKAIHSSNSKHISCQIKKSYKV